MKTIIIPLHSFVDVITNSSSEIFCNPSASTIKALEEMLDNVLKVGGSNLKSKDLFQIDITKQIEYTVDGKYVNEFFTDQEIKQHIKSGKLKKDDIPSNYGEPVKSYLRVKPLTDSIEAIKAAKTLSNLTGLFDIEDVSC